jgi:hypothetical protein
LRRFGAKPTLAFHNPSMVRILLIKLQDDLTRERGKARPNAIQTRLHGAQMRHKAAPLMKYPAVAWVSTINGVVLHKGSVVVSLGSVHRKRSPRSKHHVTFLTRPWFGKGRGLVELCQGIIAQ